MRDESRVTPDLANGFRKVGVHHGKGCLKDRAPGNSYQIKSFESALTSRIRLLPAEDFTQAPLRAIPRHGISKLAGSDKTQPIAGAAVCDPQYRHVFRGHPVSALLDRQ